MQGNMLVVLIALLFVMCPRKVLLFPVTLDYNSYIPGVKDIIVGRDDGTIEVLGFEQGLTPTVLWKTNINESIQACEKYYVLFN
jgi:hypothetical protein